MRRLLPLAVLLLVAGCSDAIPTEPGAQPPPPSMSYEVVESCTDTICGPVYIYIDGPQMYNFSWSSTPTQGTAPYSYAWTIHYDLWGSGAVGTNSSSVSFGVNGSDGHFYLQVAVRDAYNTLVHNDWHRVLVCDTPMFC